MTNTNTNTSALQTLVTRKLESVFADAVNAAVASAIDNALNAAIETAIGNAVADMFAAPAAPAPVDATPAAPAAPAADDAVGSMKNLDGRLSVNALKWIAVRNHLDGKNAFTTRQLHYNDADGLYISMDKKHVSLATFAPYSAGILRNTQEAAKADAARMNGEKSADTPAPAPKKRAADKPAPETVTLTKRAMRLADNAISRLNELQIGVTVETRKSWLIANERDAQNRKTGNKVANWIWLNINGDKDAITPDDARAAIDLMPKGWAYSEKRHAFYRATDACIIEGGIC